MTLLRAPYLRRETTAVVPCRRCGGLLDSVLHKDHCCACRTVERDGEQLSIFCWTHAPDVLASHQRIECTCGHSWLKSTRFYACRECRAEDMDATI